MKPFAGVQKGEGSGLPPLVPLGETMRNHIFFNRRLHIWLAGGLALLGAAGCALEPKGIGQERDRLREAGKSYEAPFEQRSLPDLPDQPDWRDVLQRAFLANGDLEAAYFDWQAAVRRVEIVSGYPNTNVVVGYSYMFSDEQMKTFDRMTFSANFDGMENLSFPTKVMQAGRVALDGARAAGERFGATKFEVQEQVLTAWWDYALAAEKLRIQREQVDLLRMLSDSAAQRVRNGGAQQDLLKADTEYELAVNELENMQSELTTMRAMLNGMLARSADAALAPPVELPAVRPIPAGDDVLLAAAVDHNPQLADLAHQVQGRHNALELARMQWIPDINPAVAFTGGVSQVVGAAIVLPTTIVEIRGMIRESRSMLAGSQAMLRQARFDRASQFVATLVALRNNERQVALFEQSILSKAEQVLASSQRAYSAGSVGFADLIDSQRMLLDIRLMVAEARMAREKRLVELERLAGLDIETLATEGQARVAVSLREETDHE